MAKPQTEFKSADSGLRSHWGHFPVFVGGFHFNFFQILKLFGVIFLGIFLEVV